MRDSLATTFDDAIGFATYSNSDATISSYVSIFENLCDAKANYLDKMHLNWHTGLNLVVILDILKAQSDKSRRESLSNNIH